MRHYYLALPSWEWWPECWIKSETGSSNGRILPQGNIIMDYDLEDRIDEDELELNSEINGKAFKMIIYYSGRL